MTVILAVSNGQVKEALDILLEQGVLGAVCVLLISAVVYMTKALQRSHGDRVRDLKAYSTKIKEDNKAMTALVGEANKVSAQLSQETILSNHEVHATMAALKDETDGMKGAIYQLKEQQVRLETAINVKKGVE